MDSYTRRNVHNAVADAGLLGSAPPGATAAFTERLLLPALNRLGADGRALARAAAV